MGRLSAAAVLLAATALAAPAAQAPEPVRFTTVAKSSQGSGYTARTTLVIRSARRYRHVWRRLHERMSPRPRRPRQDFRRHTLIAVLRTPGTGVGLDVVAVTRAGDGLRVRAAELRPGTACVVAQVVSNPYELIRVPRTRGPVTTERVERVRIC